MAVNILDAYVHQEPNPQNILDLFSGEWSSAMLSGSGLTTTPGTANLFDDDRIKWAGQVFGGFKDMRALELGPLEGGHSYMLHNMGAARVLAIEANTRAFLKCLCIKEIFGLDRVHFALGDFISYLKSQGTDSRYDVVLASGVLYHMQHPMEMLDLIAKVTDRIFIWTHYYDAAVIEARRDLSKKFGRLETAEYQDFQYESIEYRYQDALNWQGFCGGSQPTSRWLSRNSITDYLSVLGFKIHIGFDHPTHPNGPAFAICALRDRDML